MRSDTVKAPHVFVVSHERSGTHVAIDAVRNNFPVYKKRFYTNIDRMVEGHWSPRSAAEIEAEMDEGPRVVKTHMTVDAGAFFDGGGPATRLVESLLEGAKVIYVYRDARDVLGSLFTFWSRTDGRFRGTTFSEMLRGKVAGHVGTARDGGDAVTYWRDHVSGWIGREGVLALSFEQFLGSYEETVEEIGAYLGQEPVRPVKSVLRTGSGVRRGRIREALFKLYTRKIKGLELTSVSFHRGQVNGHRAVFSDEDSAFINERAGDLRTRLGYG